MDNKKTMPNKIYAYVMDDEKSWCFSPDVQTMAKEMSDYGASYLNAAKLAEDLARVEEALFMASMVRHLSESDFDDFVAYMNECLTIIRRLRGNQ